MASNSEINKLALTNGNVITIDERNPRAQAVYIVGERIVKVGSDGEIGGLIDEATDVIDLEGRTVVPGFVDCHAHPMGFGQSLMNVNCCTPPMRSIEDIVESIREAVEEKGEGEWILGRGYDDFKLAEKRHPNRWDLDSAAPDNPVIITRLCGHISVVNSLALELVGITKDTKDLEGGEIDRGDGGAHGRAQGGRDSPDKRDHPSA